MSGRPPQLFPLFAGLETLDGVGAKTAAHFAQMDVSRPRDLIFTLPQGIIDRRLRDSVVGAAAGSVVTVKVRVLRHQAPAQKGRPYRVTVEDAGTSLSLVWFRPNEGYLKNLLPVGEDRIVSGKLELFDGLAQIAHPDHVLPLTEAATIRPFEPVYPLTAGIGGRVMSRAITAALARAPGLDEWIDPALKAQRGWPDWQQALAAAHDPNGADDVSPRSPARERLAYDELFAHQMTLALARAQARSPKGRPAIGTGIMRDKVLAALDFSPTAAQRRAAAEIAADMASDRRMYRLLQGDVGAGKTLVALLALVTAVEAGGQGVLMAPTEILARQHRDALAPLADAAGCRLEVLTGRDSGQGRAAKLAALAAGEIDILVGTHAVFQADVQFADLRLAIVDEQHRFGVRQRLELGEKGARTDFLVMTATPIPRSLAMTQYGDLDLSVLDEKPPGRKSVKTALMAVDRLDDVVTHLRKAADEGRQAYWVCPLVEESESVPMVAAEQRFAQLRAVLPEGTVGLVHGQMPAERKDRAMADFVAGVTKVLVATTVIEVGVNVPNASIMVIEQAESFGLAQLHQLRGRVGRGAASSTCLLLYDTPLSETAARRLMLLRDTEDGFRIAEEDLAMRGAGDVIGVAQSGIPRFRVADLETQTDLMALAQSDARACLARDSTLSSPRGTAIRALLWLLEQDKALKLLHVG
ncbi:ATP-dependent DNA helicase RecG [Pseudoruegeria sp. SK021]|uniref:ATP-dependent DNA helicase RecG n=1 Tax=Pseudoruegeria sp. SK021 TaxID=1933035 RepID=UPI000A24F495|nr:ATP-dependent DNA helicase RecG [Pseudoruegeria sp. SK021]OSP55509.1 ATP-dependent DNA helicase RecG [Pseudoruegeria sp. SK021]